MKTGHRDRQLTTLPSLSVHVWDYRRYLLSQIALAAVPPSSTGNIPPFPYSLTDPTLPSYTRTHHLALANSELSYTLRKIESNFSNFSAWHWRSKLLPCLWSSSSTDEKQKVQEEEFELLRQAIYTDPSDQSVWLYHSWLIAESNSSERQKKVLRREIESIEELVELEPDSKCESFSTQVLIELITDFPCHTSSCSLSRSPLPLQDSPSLSPPHL